MTAAPLVSVALITYRHERYVAQAIESVLAQEADFAVELVIGEDCSPDGTRAIVEGYGRRHPDRIRLLLPDRNQGATANFAATIGACRGRYVALLEGDDHWTDPAKLARQVAHLEAHPEQSSCFTGTVAIDGDGTVIERIRPLVEKPAYDLDDVLGGEFFPTAATMYRREAPLPLPPWFGEVRADFVLALHILNAQSGPIGNIDEDMAAYRRHDAGLWSGADLPLRLQWTAHTFDLVDRHLGRRKAAVIGITRRSYRAAVAARATGDLPEARRFAARALRSYPHDRSVAPHHLLKEAVGAAAPGAVATFRRLLRR